MSDWLPIETAPKDGTMIDVWAVGGYDGDDTYKGVAVRYVDCLWFSETAAPRWTERGNEDGVENFGMRITHWMPRPTPPQAEKTGA